MNTKSFWLMVMAGVVAMAAYRAIGNTKVGARILGAGPNSSQYSGDQLGVSIFGTLPAPSGHGDATQNATGACCSTVSAYEYAPAFYPAGGAPQGSWTGVV